MENIYDWLKKKLKPIDRPICNEFEVQVASTLIIRRIIDTGSITTSTEEKSEVLANVMLQFKLDTVILNGS